MKSLIKYIRDTRAEMKHVAWPTQQQTSIYTALVVALSLLTAAYLGFFDFLFTRTLEATLDILPGQRQEQVLPHGTTDPAATSTNSDEASTGVEFDATGGDIEINAGSQESTEAPAADEQSETTN